MNKILVIVGILVVVALGFWFISEMTGNVITGAVVGDEVVENELFKINEDKEVLNGAQNSSGRG